MLGGLIGTALQPSQQVTPSFFFFFFTLVTGPRRSLRLKLSDTRVYEPQTRARLGTTAHRVGYGALRHARGVDRDGPAAIAAGTPYRKPS